MRDPDGRSSGGGAILARLCVLSTCTIPSYEYVGHEATLSRSRNGEVSRAVLNDFF